MPGFDMVGNIGGRFCMNLTPMYSLIKAFGLKSLSGVLEDVFGKIPPILDVPRVKLFRWKFIKQGVPTAIRVRLRIWKNLKGMRAFLATSRRRCEKLRTRIAAAVTAPELADLYAGEIEPHAVTAWRMLEVGGCQGGTSLLLTPPSCAR
ncbi:hypothetical protein [Nonomuraea sp. NPDC049480]|uniref:hypothetical protein n=1 Tax=Nonomuraea sp. NPDC049480 TaxID=3364353 RepID=UPI0037A14560